jgi:hypoxanthine phosphoribosyltransferase
MTDSRVRVLFDEETIARRCEELAAEIVADEPKDLLVVAVLKGSFMFAADLIRALHRAGLDPQVEFIHLSSYRDGMQSSGQVTILRDVESAVQDRDVLLIDDILESGRTIVFAKDLLVGARRPPRPHGGAAGKARQARGADRGRSRRLHLPRQVRRRLRHGHRPLLPTTPVRRGDRYLRHGSGPVRSGVNHETWARGM